MILKKGIAEFVGTFALVLFGTGTAVVTGGAEVITVAMAFGLSIVAMAYSIGTISGCHINPAVTIAMLCNRRMSASEAVIYIISQLLGAMAATGLLIYLLSSAGMSIDNLGQNSTTLLGSSASFVVELVLTFLFVLTIVVVTGKNGSPQLAGLVIGLALVLVHVLGIKLTGTSVNPARSFSPAIFVGGEALQQLWVFIVAPLLGGLLAALFAKTVLNSEESLNA